MPPFLEVQGEIAPSPPCGAPLIMCVLLDLLHIMCVLLDLRIHIMCVHFILCTPLSTNINR